MHRSLVVVDEQQPGQPLEPFVLACVLQLLLVARVVVALLTRMGLPRPQLEELDALAVPGVKLLERLDRADRDRSGAAAHV
jgi:hypothetical protein